MTLEVINEFCSVCGTRLAVVSKETKQYHRGSGARIVETKHRCPKGTRFLNLSHDEHIAYWRGCALRDPDRDHSNDNE